jgi:hypothetical protein
MTKGHEYGQVRCRRDGLKRMSLLDDFVDVTKTIDFVDQNVTRPLRDNDGEKENIALGSNVLRHNVRYRNQTWFQDGGHASLCPPYEISRSP